MNDEGILQKIADTLEEAGKDLLLWLRQTEKERNKIIADAVAEQKRKRIKKMKEKISKL